MKNEAHLYRCFDKDDGLLYIGCTKRLVSRITVHRELSLWGPKIHRIQSEGFATRESALSAEANAIASEHPEFNIQHRKRPRKGRPATLGPQFIPESADQDAEMRDLWLDRERPEAYKLRRIGEIYGSPVARGQLFYRYGTAEKPKPQR